MNVEHNAESDRGLYEQVKAECERLARSADECEQTGQHEYASGLREVAYRILSILADSELERDPADMADACLKVWLTPSELQRRHQMGDHEHCPATWCMVAATYKQADEQCKRPRESSVAGRGEEYPYVEPENPPTLLWTSVTPPAAACEDHDGCGWCPTHDCAAAACAHEHAQTSVTPPGGQA